MKLHYEVQHYTFCQGWINCWTNIGANDHETPSVFSSRALAKTSLEDYFSEELYDFNQGNRDYLSDTSDYRIVEVTT